MSEEEIMQALPEFSLQIQGDDTHPVISNFDDLKEWVNKAVDYAKGQITSTDAKDLKPVRAQLNKLYEKLEDARKNLKRRLEAPYKEWEIQYKDAVSSLLDASDEIGTLIKTQETRERDMRLAEIEKQTNSAKASIRSHRKSKYAHGSLIKNGRTKAHHVP